MVGEVTRAAGRWTTGAIWAAPVVHLHTVAGDLSHARRSVSVRRARRCYGGGRTRRWRGVGEVDERRAAPRGWLRCHREETRRQNAHRVRSTVTGGPLDLAGASQLSGKEGATAAADTSSAAITRSRSCPSRCVTRARWRSRYRRCRSAWSAAPSGVRWCRLPASRTCRRRCAAAHSGEQVARFRQSEQRAINLPH